MTPSSLIFIITLLAINTLSAPLQPRQEDTVPAPFTLLAIHSGDPSLQYQSINAHNSSFYIGEPTTTSCPTDENINCPTGNVTALAVDNTSGRAGLNTEVAGGQALYLSTTGALSFTEAHSSGPSDGTYTGFNYANNTVGTLGEFSYTGNGSTGFLACPVATNATAYGPYQIFAAIAGLADGDVPSGSVSACKGIDALGATYEGVPSAWQYV